MTINLCADIGESFGAYKIGDDDAMLGIVRSASIACGFHGGDPVTMHDVVKRAKEAGVSIGCHPSYNDLWGFGRRRIDTSADHLEYMIAYQIGALQAFAAYVGEKVTHLQPHGAVANVAAEQEDAAMAIGRAIRSVDRGIIYVAPPDSWMEKAGRKLGLRVALEGFCDRSYDDDGKIASRKLPGAVHTDPDVVASQVLRIALHGEVVSRTGKVLPQRVHTLCVHGDEPTGVATAKAARKALEDAGVKIVTLPEMNFE
ncbi:MAG: 5-oxoprolinase subunit PxpA [Rhizobiales bacterium]|nr:5-oxoprolinase subunit PxpA [Hyphomicrobiales bacterium]